LRATHFQQIPFYLYYIFREWVTIYSSFSYIRELDSLLKDARSVSLYPYNRSQILQCVKFTKYINITKGIAKLCDKKCVFGQIEKNHQQQKTKNKT